MPFHRQEAEDRVRPACDGDRDGQHVVDEQGRTRDHTGRGREELCRHEVAASAGREELDDLRVARANNEDGSHAHQQHDQRKVRMRTERLEGFLGSIAGGRQAVGTEPHPRQHGDERDLVEQARVGQAPGPTDEEVLQPRGQRCFRVHSATAAKRRQWPTPSWTRRFRARFECGNRGRRGNAGLEDCPSSCRRG